MAVHTSDVEPLPHQISAVYEAMLPRQPLRFVLADDPGAGKTIMAGLLIRELIMRSDAQRILVVSPGSLSGQWQDELRDKFGLEFTLFSREQQELSANGNAFNQTDHMIARLDQLARNDDLKEKLRASHWDLIIIDEARKQRVLVDGEQAGQGRGDGVRHGVWRKGVPSQARQARHLTERERGYASMHWLHMRPAGRRIWPGGMTSFPTVI